MTSIRVTSVAEPFRSHHRLAASAYRLLFISEYVGALPVDRPQRYVVDLDLVKSLGTFLGGGTVSPTLLELRRLSDQWAEPPQPGQASDEFQRELLTLLDRLNAEVDESPRPEGEWAPVLRTLGEDLVATLVDTSVTSVRRYSTGNRVTPQAIAERLHFLALLLAELAGSYNDYGMRRWFTRPRTALSGQSPADVMGAGFDPDGPDARQLEELAEGLRAG